MTDVSWEYWRSFLAVAQTGSLSAAARALGLTQPTVGRHVDALEAQLGVALFTRSPGGLNLTALATTLVPHAANMAAAADNLVRTSSGELAGNRGTVRVAASEIVGTFVLPGILAAFRARHPGITLELSLSNQNEDLLRRDADIAVRMGRPEQGALVARRVGGIPIGLYASRSYLAARGVPATVSDLAGHDFVGRDRAPGLGGGLRVGDYVVSSQQFVFRCDSDVAQLAAVRAGLGIGVCQHGVARGDPDLVPVFPEVRYTLDTWVVMHEDLRASQRVRLLFEHLVEQLVGYVRQGELAGTPLA